MGLSFPGGCRANGPPGLGHVVVVQDKSLSNADELRVARRRVAIQLSGHAVVGLRNDLRIERVRLRRSAGGHWIGRVDWTHRALIGAKATSVRRLRRQAHHQLLQASLAGRGAQLMDSFGWPGDTFLLDYAAPATEKALALAELISPHDPWRAMHGSLQYVGKFIQKPVVARSIRQLASVIAREQHLPGVDVAWWVAGAIGRVDDA
jgi:hypothetical protein